MRLLTLLTTVAALIACGCQAPPAAVVRHARLGDAGAFAALRSSFAANNPGYDVCFHAQCRELAPCAADRVVFVQGPIARSVAPTVGDVLLVRADELWRLNGVGSLDLVAFTLPDPLPASLPAIVRPDWDPLITDTPGGCATEGDAYRRILLTWKPEVGPYILRQLNAHRVRIKNSFSHYHPFEGGFDEFYLVQQAPAGARLLTSPHVDQIEARAVTAADAQTLVQSQELHVGDLIYLPRGTMHRGLGGALVQVISVPGFVPRSEIGLDHHLWAINKQLGLRGDAALPFHVVAARTSVVK